MSMLDPRYTRQLMYDLTRAPSTYAQQYPNTFGSLTPDPYAEEEALRREITPNRQDLTYDFFKNATGSETAGSIAQFLDPAAFVLDERDAASAAANRGDSLAAAGHGAMSLAGVVPIPAAKVAKVASKAVPEVVKKVGRQVMTQLPDIRRLPIPEAVATAETNQHLVPSSGSKGFVGGPPNISNMDDLLAQRAKFDANVRADERGADWYPRYREDIREVTGDDVRDNLWMANQHAQWSRGVSPQSELQYVLKENNGALMGSPTKAMYGDQHRAHLTAIAENDPMKYSLANKTGEYAHKLNPDINAESAVGTNDFRHAREWGYPVGSGTSKTSLSVPEHRFVDYETAQAVGRANREGWGGRHNWTGEDLQAAPWVRQKAGDLSQTRNYPIKERDAMVADWPTDPAEAEAYGMVLGPRLNAEAQRRGYEKAFPEANSTLREYFDKHTAFATHEAQPGETTGHLPLSLSAGNEERAAFAADPRSSWAFAPGGRDAMYSGLRAGDTGVAARVRPTTPMLGSFQDKSNPGWVARPLVAFDQGAGGTKAMTAADENMLRAGESLRAAIDAQDMGGAHKVWAGGRASDSNSMFVPLSAAVTPETMQQALAAGARRGVGDVVDTGQGLTFTNFAGSPAASANKFDPKGLTGDLQEVLPGAKDAYRVKVDAISEGLFDKWQKGEGSGAVTRHVLDRINVTPEARAAFDNNPYLAKAALDRIARDKDWSKKWGVQRKDIERFREIVATGRGWVGRMEQELKKSPGTLPAIALAVVGGSQMAQDDRAQ